MIMAFRLADLNSRVQYVVDRIIFYVRFEKICIFILNSDREMKNHKNKMNKQHGRFVPII